MTLLCTFQYRVWLYYVRYSAQSDFIISVTIQILTLLCPLQAESDDFIMSVPVQSLTLLGPLQAESDDFIMFVPLQSLTLLGLFLCRVWIY